MNEYKQFAEELSIPRPPALGYHVPATRNNIGRKLKDLRNHHMHSRATIVRAMNSKCAVNTLRAIEIGRHVPRIDVLLDLANLYGVTINYLVGDADCHFKIIDPMERFRTQGRKLK